MKKVFIVLVMALMSLGAQAQDEDVDIDIDESVLLGHWESMGTLLRFSEEGYLWIRGFTFNSEGLSYIEVYNDEGQFVLPYNCSDYFVSNQNKLHFVPDGSQNTLYQKFVIERFYKRWDDYLIMVLRRFGDQYSYSFRKKIESSSVNSAKLTQQYSGDKYNLQGMKVEDPEGIYIQNGQKFIAK